MKLTIRAIETAAERQLIHKQRRAIFVEELGYDGGHADPADPLDDTGFLLGAFDGSRLAGSVRLNYGDAAQPGWGFGEYAELRDLHRFEHYFPSRLFMVTRLMIDKPYRGGTLMARFAVACYLHMLKTRPECAFCLIDCVASMKIYFERLGARQVGAGFRHPTAGPALPMAFALYDRDHFRRGGSPVYTVCPRHDPQDAAWFERAFAGELSAFQTLPDSPVRPRQDCRAEGVASAERT